MLNYDFVYENNGMLVGFHKEQIIDAVKEIQGGENWRKIIASKIQDTKCKDFLVFFFEHSIESRHVKAEINLALNLDKKITTVCMVQCLI